MKLVRILLSALAAAGLLLGACRSSAPTATAPPEDALGFETLLQGYQSGIHATGVLLLTSEAEWRGFWKQHAGWMLPAPEAPKVDFGTRSMLAVLAGDRPSGGWGIDLAWIAPRGQVLVAHARQRRPAPDAIVPMSVTQPYHLVTIPRASGLVELEIE